MNRLKRKGFLFENNNNYRLRIINNNLLYIYGLRFEKNV